jgi:NTE family protein
VQIDGRVLIDGGLVNPLPFDLVAGEADLTVAVDASGAPVPRPGRDMPKAWETLFASNFIFERSIIREKLRHRHPDLYIDAGTSRFQILDFLKVDEILAAAEPAKERVKAALTRMLEAETLPHIEASDQSAARELPAPRSRSRGLLLRRHRPAKG